MPNKTARILTAILAVSVILISGCVSQQQSSVVKEYPSEKTIFEDGSVTVWRLTNNSGEDRIFYQEPSYFSPDGKKFLFRSDRGDGQYRIYTVDIASGEIRLVRESSSFGWAPCWSKDGSKIYIGDTGRILVVDANTLAEKEIKIPTDLWITFIHASPDGQRLLFVEENTEAHKYLLTIKTDGSEYKQLFEADQKEVFYFDHPIFVSNDVVIALTRGKDRDFSGWYNVPYLISMDGSKKRLSAVCSHYDVNVQKQLVLCGSEGYIVDLQGNKTEEFEDLRGHGVWASDGETFLMTPDPVPVPSGQYYKKIVLLSLGSDERKVLIGHGNSYDSSLAVHTQPNAQFSPDGKSVIYESDKDGQTDLYMAFVK